MKCRDFDAIAGDLARSRLMEVSTRAGAESHAAKCERCKALLVDERIVVEGLTAIADLDREKVAAKWRETDLRAAFRAHRIEEQSQVSSLNRRIASRPMRLTISAAAVLIVLLGGLLAWRVVGSKLDQSTPVVFERKDGAVTPQKPAETQMLAINQKGASIAVGGAAVIRSGSKRSGRKLVPSKSGDSSYVVGSLAELRPIINETEEVSDFFPLVPGGEVTPLARGQVVRVVMPRSAMAYFGLPVNVDRRESQVKADVLFGEDNLARAIRFVR